jgi:hypothetical protein
VQLVAKNEVFKSEVTTRSQAGKNAAEQDENELKHPAGKHPRLATSRSGEVDGVLPPFTHESAASKAAA